MASLSNTAHVLPNTLEELIRWSNILIHSLINNKTLIAFYVLASVLGPRHKTENKTDKIAAPQQCLEKKVGTHNKETNEIIYDNIKGY